MAERAAERGRSVAPLLRDVRYVEGWLRRAPWCQCCGSPFEFSAGKGRSSPRTPSADALLPDGCYSVENTNFICVRCNILKRDADSRELMRLAEWVRRVEDRMLLGEWA
jgi:hypothetical protein